MPFFYHRFPFLTACTLSVWMASFVPIQAQVKDAHPIVAGFERFYDGGDKQGGRLLLTELNCLSCHQGEAGKSAEIAVRQAPILDGIGNRVQRGFLRK